MSGYGWRPHIESALKLDVRRLLARGFLRVGCTTSGSWVWTDSYTGEQTASMSYRGELGDTDGTLTLLYTVPDRDTGKHNNVVCRILLSSIPLHFGGRRWYMHCPVTGRRVQTLQKWNRIDLFCHRTAIRPRPTYASQRVSGSNRIMAQRWAIRRKMGDTLSDLFGEPYKPKGMRWRTFERYAERDAELAERENGYLLRLVGLLERYG
ncbi:hypothetical protein [Rhodanobacter sp. C05]|uniref:hypothetical protein n=1 Tax=Rhodanobacter sp. C05 TaxID=1945855 RepID=UPI0009869F06|nr:hypothetical protein [Rhodanobacter sp. C05]OOG38176.1 hypothetical protein B0E51_15165 [Rhodanobacter sp. C05]